MSWGALFTAIGGVAGIFGSLAYFFNWFTWETHKTPAETDAEIDQANEKAKEDTEATGRPQ